MNKNHIKEFDEKLNLIFHLGLHYYMANIANLNTLLEKN
jgi:hypothetical protein